MGGRIVRAFRWWARLSGACGVVLVEPRPGPISTFAFSGMVEGGGDFRSDAEAALNKIRGFFPLRHTQGENAKSFVCGSCKKSLLEWRACGEGWLASCVTGEEGVGGALGEMVAAAGVADEGSHAVAVRLEGEFGGAEVLFIQGEESREVLADEAQVSRARALFQEQRLGGEEAGAGVGGAGGHPIQRLGCVGEAGEEWGAEDAGGEACLAEFGDGLEAEVGAGGAGFEEAGEVRVGGGDGDVEDKGVCGGDLLEEVDVAGDEVRLGGDPNAVAPFAGEDFEQAAGDLGTTLDGLVGIGGGAEGDLLVGADLVEVLLEEPGCVLLEEDPPLERRGPALGLVRCFCGVRDGRFCRPRRLQKFVGVSGVTVAAGELATAIGVDGPGEAGEAPGDGLIEDGAGLEGFEFDVVALARWFGFCDHAGEAGWCMEDGEEGGAVLRRCHIRHLFASWKLE